MNRSIQYVSVCYVKEGEEKTEASKKQQKKYRKQK